MKKTLTLLIFVLTAALLATSSLAATTESVLYSFTNTPDGRSPQGGLVFDGANKTLYGSFAYGGVNNRGGLFSVTTNGTGYKQFSSLTNSDTTGTVPTGLGQAVGTPVVVGGTVYAIAATGGAYEPAGGRYYSSGGVFSDSTNNGAYTVLNVFGKGNDDGKVPAYGLIKGVDGGFYGITKRGGSGGCGTIFRITSSGNYTVLYNFLNNGGGINPVGGLIQATNSLLYGTTENGGTYRNGTVFSIATNGTSFTSLYSFGNSPDGAQPHGSLLLATNALIYGTTSAGGTNGFGTVFSMTLTGESYTQLKSFSGGTSDGAQPESGLVQRPADGNIYGTTAYGGSARSYGTVFVFTNNAFINIWNFTNANDGITPLANPVVGSAGELFGTTSAGGASGYGAVYRLIP